MGVSLAERRKAEDQKVLGRQLFLFEAQVGEMQTTERRDQNLKGPCISS